MMIYYIQTGVFSLVILTLVFVVVNSKPDRRNFDHKLFSLLVLTVALATVLDVVMYLLDGQPGDFRLVLNKLTTLLYYICNPLVGYIWSLYADHMVYRDELRVRRRALLLSIPTILVTILSLISIWTEWLFRIDSDNVYHRGPFFMIMAILAYFYMMYSLALIITNRTRILHSEFLPMIFFIVPATIGAVVQLAFIGISTLWMSISLSVLIVFVYIMNQSMGTDHLTGLYNRRQLDSFLTHVSQMPSSKHRIAGMMIDLNNMKLINDHHGHQAGDEALERTAQILRQSLRKEDFIARYGGDEFAAIFLVDDNDGLDKALLRLNSNVQAFNEVSTLPFKIELSIGCGIYDPSTDKTIEDFMRRLDEKMYEAKPAR